MKIKYIILILLLNLMFFVSCTKIKVEKSYYENGNLKSVYYLQNDSVVESKTYYPDGNKKYIFKIENGVRIDTFFEYYKNNRIKNYITQFNDFNSQYREFDENSRLALEGSVFKKKKIGWWSSYKSDKLTKQVYYAQNGDSVFIAQIKIFDRNGKLDHVSSDYVGFMIPDTLYMGKSTGTILYKKKLGLSSQENICIGYNLMADYSNIAKARVDTFYTGESKGFFGVEFKELGSQKIRGFIYEVLPNRKSDTLLVITTNKIFFDKEFFVVPRLDSIPKDKIMRYGFGK
ncbi:hypothetical protein [Flavobacterium sp. NKUCC04_CG]|uniref:hypothetical protein n=1 Tax=Flavobacterium sp. NKUCC04_CG TaxID=2842121 RepID=UPI001C5AF6B5|nr:hypothetical protein [Flavobacterium sp. NKUCC04_CG]MBW3520166.1 hypothetical protein [Flavobacterium sp. NKUCC04_CG]